MFVCLSVCPSVCSSVRPSVRPSEAGVTSHFHLKCLFRVLWARYSIWALVASDYSRRFRRTKLFGLKMLDQSKIGAMVRMNWFVSIYATKERWYGISAFVSLRHFFSRSSNWVDGRWWDRKRLSVSLNMRRENASPEWHKRLEIQKNVSQRICFEYE